MPVKEVYFLRHGEAGKASGRGRDFDRPLTPEGIARLEREAHFIAGLHLELDAILTSPLVRARQTAEIFARALGLTGSLDVDERLAPGFGVEALRDIMGDHPKAGSLVLVGHEPDFSAAISQCTGGGRVECKKGAVARVDFDDLSKPLSGILAWLLPPRVMAP